MKIHMLIEPAPGRVCDVEAENYAQIFWLKPNGRWCPEPNPCPAGEVGDIVDVFGEPYTITAIDVRGGPQIATPELPWKWVISVIASKEHGDSP